MHGPRLSRPNAHKIQLLSEFLKTPVESWKQVNREEEIYSTKALPTLLILWVSQPCTLAANSLPLLPSYAITGPHSRKADIHAGLVGLLVLNFGALATAA